MHGKNIIQFKNKSFVAKHTTIPIYIYIYLINYHNMLKFLYKYADIVWSSCLVSCQLWKKHNDPINIIVNSSSAIFGGRISIG